MNLNSHSTSSLGLAILLLCEIRGWSQRDLAEASGVSRGRINKILKGVTPTTRSLGRIAHALGVNVGFLRWLARLGDTVRQAYERTANKVAVPSVEHQFQSQGLVDISGSLQGTLQAYCFQALEQFPRPPQPEDRLWAEVLWARMRHLSAEDQSLLVRALQADERIWALAERICEASVAAASDRADEAQRLARTAVAIASRCTGSEDWRSRLQGYCELFLANAYRVGGDFAASEYALLRAEKLWNQGELAETSSILDPTRALGLRASLLMYRGRSEEALGLLDQAMAATPLDEAKVRLLLKRGRALEALGRYKEAIEELRKAELLGTSGQEARLGWGVQLNLAVNYCHVDMHQKAESLLPRIGELGAGLENALDFQRVLWLKGRIAAGMGRRSEALTALSDVRQHFLSQKIAYDFALVSLELATLYLEDGQIQRVKDIAEEVPAIFQSQKLHKEALAALTLFCHAAKREEADVEWTRRLIKYLYRAQHNPGLRFENGAPPGAAFL